MEAAWVRDGAFSWGSVVDPHLVQVKTFSLVLREKPRYTGRSETAFFPLPIGSRL